MAPVRVFGTRFGKNIAGQRLCKQVFLEYDKKIDTYIANPDLYTTLIHVLK